MATNTTNYGFKKPDESDFYDVADQNKNWDLADEALKNLDTPTFEDYTGSTAVPSATDAIDQIKSKGKLGTLLSNIKAAFKGACLIGHIVNNCVTDNAGLPLSAAQGKVLKDLYTQLYSDLNTTNNNLSNISYSWPVQFVGNGESLKTVVNKYCKSNTSQKYILNRIADSPFVYDGTTIITGSLTLDYSFGYWNNHPLYTLISDNHVYTGTINMSEWKVDTIVCHATKPDLYPSYDQITLFSDVKADVTDKNITITENGMVQVAAKTQATDGTAFIRLVINGACVYEGHTVSGKYRYLWTPIFPVKKGDIIKVTLQTGTTDGQRFVYFYKS